MEDQNEGSLGPKKRPLLRKKVLFIPAAIAAVTILVAKTILMPVEVAGDSMSPTYRHGSIHFIYKLAYRDRPPQRGDIVAIRTPDGDLYIKRIVGLPNEVIAIEEGMVWINGRRLEEPFNRGAIRARLKPTRLDKSDFFVVGDNRATSVLGAISRERIVGKLVH